MKKCDIFFVRLDPNRNVPLGTRVWGEARARVTLLGSGFA